MSAINLQLGLGLIWISGCATFFFWLLRHPDRPLPGVRLAAIAGLFARLVPAALLPRGAGYEMHVFQQAADLMRAGENVYRSQVAHPYLPFQLYWMTAADWLAEHVGLFFIFWLKLDSILADVAIIILVYFAIRRLSGCNDARHASWLYALNPVTILVAAYQGQFDAIPLLLLLVAWYRFSFADSRRDLAMSATALGFAMLSKTWPVLLLPIVLLRLPRWRLRAIYALLAGLVPLLGILFFELLFPGSLSPMLRRALRAGAIPGWWGYSSVLNVGVQLGALSHELFAQLSDWGKQAALLGALLFVLVSRRQPAHVSLLLTILLLFAGVPNLGLQGLSWVVAIAFIATRKNEVGWYVASALVHMGISYWGLHLSNSLVYRLLPESIANATIQLSSLIPWLVIVVWLLQELTGRRLLPAVPSANPQVKERQAEAVSAQ